MFLCDDCTKPDDYIRLLKSYGRCEECGKEAICNDVNIHHGEKEKEYIW